MTTEARDAGTADGPENGQEGLSPEQAQRAGIYSLLAALLRGAPDQPLLDHVGGLDQAAEPLGNELLLSLSMLALAARRSEPMALEDEYHALFIGLGRGELVPYGSWYQTGFLMERPLSVLRDDLAALGFERDPDIKEPEDHVAALFEVMAMLIGEGRDEARQQHFFETHIGPWVGRFFADLGGARSAVFYKAVARFGDACSKLEQRYFSLPG